MIVPDHWAEARRQHKQPGRQVTVRRFGWSNASIEEAKVMAERRADEALARLLAGEKLPRREPKVPYNGAAGVPIREEVLARHGDEVITRNAYGARCLNTPVALFADVDFEQTLGVKPVVGAAALLLALSAAVAWLLGRSGVFGVLALGSLLAALPLAKGLQRLSLAVQGGVEQRARRRLERFVAAHAAWNVRLYRTPAGLRLLATHRPCEAGESEVGAFFDAVGADPMYVRMCRHQHCFRARLTAKPWRIGIAGHLRPRPGVWPVAAEALPQRAAWVADYERRAAGFASCRYLGSVGSGAVHLRLQPVVALHDRESRAHEAGLPLG